LEILPAEKAGTSTPEILSSKALSTEELPSRSTEEDNVRLTPAADASNLKSWKAGKVNMENIIE
jgi:hypothetical protein